MRLRGHVAAMIPVMELAQSTDPRLATHSNTALLEVKALSLKTDFSPAGRDQSSHVPFREEEPTEPVQG